MYLDFFKLKLLPFRLNPDPAFVYWSAGHRSAMAGMQSALASAGGCAIVTGEHGAGKTLLLECLTSDDSHIVGVARINRPPESAPELIDSILGQVEPTPVADKKRTPQERLTDLLVESVASNRHLRVLVDDAHLFVPHILSALVLRTLAPPAAANALRILIMGQPALTRLLASPLLAGSSKLFGERCHLPPLGINDVRAYMEHRLAVAGAMGSAIFHDETFTEIFVQTGGTPRLINSLCDAAMVVACERDLRQVRLPEIQRALEDEGWLARARRDVATPVREPPAASASGVTAVEFASPPGDGAFGKLEIVHKRTVVAEQPLLRGRLRVGRAPDNELQIDSHYVSRHHCQIVTTEQMSLIEDVRSTNGLYVNERRVRRYRLEDGDVVRVGEHELVYADLRNHPSRPV